MLRRMGVSPSFTKSGMVRLPTINSATVVFGVGYKAIALALDELVYSLYAVGNPARSKMVGSVWSRRLLFIGSRNVSPFDRMAITRSIPVGSAIESTPAVDVAVAVTSAS